MLWQLLPSAGLVLMRPATGIWVERLVHNEPQFGKTELDGIFGICTQAVSRYLDAGHDVQTSAQLIEALIKYGPRVNVIRGLAIKNSKSHLRAFSRELGKAWLPDIRKVREIEYADDIVNVWHHSSVDKPQTIAWSRVPVLRGWGPHRATTGPLARPIVAALHHEQKLDGIDAVEANVHGAMLPAGAPANAATGTGTVTTSTSTASAASATVAAGATSTGSVGSGTGMWTRGTTSCDGSAARGSGVAMTPSTNANACTMLSPFGTLASQTGVDAGGHQAGVAGDDADDDNADDDNADDDNADAGNADEEDADGDDAEDDDVASADNDDVDDGADSSAAESAHGEDVDDDYDRDADDVVVARILGPGTNKELALTRVREVSCSNSDSFHREHPTKRRRAVVASEAEGPTLLNCDRCCRYFSSQARLDRHKATRCTQCDVCKRWFSSRAAAAEHGIRGTCTASAKVRMKAVDYATHLIVNDKVEGVDTVGQRQEDRARVRQARLDLRRGRASARQPGWARGNLGADTTDPEVVEVLLELYAEGVRSKRRKWSGEEALEHLKKLRNADMTPRFTYARLPTLSGIKSVFSRGGQMLASREAGQSGGGSGTRRRRRAWTAEEDASILQQLDRGVARRALVLPNRTASAVYGRAGKLAKNRSHTGKTAPASLSQVSQHAAASARLGEGGVSTAASQSSMATSRRRWTAEEDAVLRDAAEAGTKAKAIQLQNRSSAAIANRLGRFRREAQATAAPQIVNVASLPPPNV